MTEGRYDDSYLNFSEFPTEKLDCTETKNILADLSMHNDKI